MTAPHRALQRYRSPDDDAEALIRQHARLIDRCARAIVRRTGIQDQYDDLWAAGAIGLIDAARRYTKGHGVQFSSFVAHRIRGAMLDELRRLDHLPRRLRQRVNDVKKTADRLAQEQGRAVGPEEVAAATGADVGDVAELTLLDEPPLPLFEHAGAIMSDPDGTVVQEEVLERRELQGRLKAAIETLPERLKTLLSLRYEEYLTFREIASIFSLSEPRIVQLHGQAIERLRRALVVEVAPPVKVTRTRAPHAPAPRGADDDAHDDDENADDVVVTRGPPRSGEQTA